MASEEEANHRIADYKLQSKTELDAHTRLLESDVRNKKSELRSRDEKILTLGVYLICAVCLYVNVYTCCVCDTVLLYVYITRVYIVEIES